MARSVYSHQSRMSANSRASFISKTYSHLFAAIAALIGIEYFLLQSEAAVSLAQKMVGNWLLVLGAFMVISWVASMFAHKVENKPLQYIGLGMYVAGFAVMMLPLLLYAIAVTGDGELIFKAAMITVSGTAGLSAIAFLTRKNFSFLKSIVMFGGLLAIILIGCQVIFGISLGIWFSIGMVGLMGISILYTTSNIIHEYHEEMYVGAALALFSSIATLFWYVLQLLISLSGDD